MAKDPYRYFRIEAREVLDGLERAVAALESAERAPETVPLLLRLAHTLKGAARVVRAGKISTLAHQLEEVLEPLRAGAAATAPQAAESRRLLGAMNAALAAIDRPPEGPAPTTAAAAPTPAATPAPAMLDTLRLQVAEVDAMANSVAETMGELAALRADFRVLAPATRQARLIRALAGRSRVNGTGVETAARLQSDADDLAAHLDSVRQRVGSRVERLGRDLQRLHEEAGRLRLLPTDALWSFLDRAVRDAAQTLGKRVRLETQGRTPRLDTPVFAGVQEALLHLARNAVAHGIEPEAARRAAGKPAEGRVRVRIEHRIGRLRIVCEDDGGGIDVEAVRRAALAKSGRDTVQAAAMDMDAAIHFLLQGGVSTAQTAGQISGRGVGLDAARAATARLGGELTLTSTARRGTTAVLDVPVALSAVEALTVESRGQQVMLPLEAVREVLRLPATALHTAGEREDLQAGQEAIPYAALHRFLPGPAGATPPRRQVTAVIVRGDAGPAALGVDRLLGVSEAVIRPLPALADALHVAGASPGADGVPRLMLDAQALAAAVSRTAPEHAPAARRRPPILVVDDSLTTRMLEQSILESAGYTVDLAVSGDDALVRLREKSYGLMLVDLEMPGMDGFTVIEHVRRDPALRLLPAILVTSRESREDRQRGIAAGAQDYFVKGDFDQRRLLQRIAELLA